MNRDEKTIVVLKAVVIGILIVSQIHYIYALVSILKARHTQQILNPSR